MPEVVNSAITKPHILNISANKDAYERGEKYYQDGKLISYNEVDLANGGLNVRACIEGNYKNYDVSLKIDRHGVLTNHTCTCESYSIWRGACKHVVAALFANLEGHARMFSAERMKQHAAQLAKSLEKVIFDGIDEDFSIPVMAESGSRLKLTPVLNWVDGRGLFLTFAVGLRRMYVIKSISGFVNSCRAGETVTYGQGLTITHRREMFDESSQKLLDFMIYEDEMYDEIGRRLARQFQFTHHPLIGSRELNLARRNIDNFFDIYFGDVLEIVSDFSESVKLVEGYPPVGLNIRYLATGTILSCERFQSRSVQGVRYNYIITSGGFHRVPKADGRLLTALLKSLDDSPTREIFFTGGDELKFQTVIFPQLSRMGVINSIVGSVPKVNVSPISAAFYFGAEKKDITGRLEYIYGDVVIDAAKEALNEGASDGDIPKYASGEVEIVRDVVSEYGFRRRLISIGFLEDKKSGEFRLRGNDLIYAFLHGGGIVSLQDIAEVFISEELKKKTKKAGTPKIGLTLSGDLLKVSLEDTGYEIGELLEALDAYRTRKKYYRLKDGRFITLEHENVAAMAEFLETLDVSKKDVKGKSVVLPSYRALYVDELTRLDALSTTHALKRDENFESLLYHFANNQNLGFKIPKTLVEVLREYQKTGYSWLKTLSHYGFGGILADDMGLGKTLQVITLLLSEKGDGPPSIVVAPTSLLYNWENEIRKFAPKLTTQIIAGFPEKRRELIHSVIDADVYITTYDMLKRDIEHYEGMEFSYIIADEAQNFKNPGTQAAKSIKELKGRVRFALTGTPIENNLMELWSIFDFIMPGYLYSANKFNRIYEAPIVKLGDANAAEKLRTQIAPFVLRRMKMNVLKELPEKTETTLQADLTTEQKKIYHATLLKAIGAFDDIIKKGSFADNRMQILAQLTRLRQICCHPSLYLDDYSGDSGKLSLTLETIQISIESGHRVLLFSQFTGMLELIKKALKETNISVPGGRPLEYFYIDGGVKAKERMEMTESFNAGERDLFLVSLKAGGTGLNLTGADVVIHYDPWWNPSVMDQASDRAHRFGQKNVVHVFNIVAKDSIEEKIMALQEKKRGLIDSVITEGGSFINHLSEEEVRMLFS